MSIKDWHNDTIGQKVVEALKKNKFDAVYFPDKEGGAKYILNFIKEGATVGIGGSVTINELNILDKMQEMGAVVLNHNVAGITAEEKLEIRRKQMVSDVFLCSSNAITLDGQLVNMDGAGNRVAAMTFGPKKVLIVAGVNKITKDVHSAIERIQLTASPLNNKRLDYKNPCATTGVCSDCKGDTRICNILTVMKRKPMATDVTVVLIGEVLGY